MAWFDGMTIDEVIAHLRTLKAGADKAEQVCVRACIELEQSDIWKKARGPRDATFAVFLDRMGVCDEKWYLRRKHAYADPNLACHIETTGLAAMARAAEISNLEERGKVVSSLLEATKDRGCPLPDRTAKSIADGVVGGKIRLSASTMFESRIAELETENRKLRAEVARLTREVARLNGGIAGISSESKADEETARKPARKSAKMQVVADSG